MEMVVGMAGVEMAETLFSNPRMALVEECLKSMKAA